MEAVAKYVFIITRKFWK